MPDPRLTRAIPGIGVAALGVPLTWLGAVYDVGPWPVVAIVVLAVTAAWLRWWLGRRRAAALETFAASIGWTYVGDDPFLADAWQRRPFGPGENRRVSELVVGRYAGRPAKAFVYRYTTGSGDNRQDHEYHVVCIALPTWLPSLQLSPQSRGTALLKGLGGADLQLESEDFNRAWWVEARDAKYAHDVLHPRTMERLTRPDARVGNLAISGADAVSWRSGTTDVASLAARLAVLSALVDGIPRFVWLDNGYDPAGPSPRYDPDQSSKESPRWSR